MKSGPRLYHWESDLILSQPTSDSVTLSEAKGLPHVGMEILHLHSVPVQNDMRGGLVCLNSAARFDKWNRAAVR